MCSVLKKKFAKKLKNIDRITMLKGITNRYVPPDEFEKYPDPTYKTKN